MMRHETSIPAAIDWPLRPITSAQIGWRVAASGQLRIVIAHEFLPGITTAMLEWWFGHIHGETEVDGHRLSRYRCWHARDHRTHDVVRYAAGGIVGPGAQFHIVEEIGGRRVDTVVTVAQLDQTGVALQRSVAGRQIFRIAHEFNRHDRGTHLVTRITIGFAGSRRWTTFNRTGRMLAFPDRFARALCRHSVEEVGNFVHFLPALYATGGVMIAGG